MKKAQLFIHNNFKWLRLLLIVPFILWGIYFFSNRFLAYPLDFTPQQNVLREPPVFHLDESVDVEAVFINTGKKDVTFAGAIHWVLVSPLETGVAEAETEVILLGLQKTITPGCHEIEFINNAPSRVRTITKDLFNAGHSRVTWRLTGNNVITEPSGRGSMVFNVDDFTYIPDNIPLPTYTDIKDDKACT